MADLPQWERIRRDPNHEHVFVNYGRKGQPRMGCWYCGCTPDDPTPEAVKGGE